MVRLQISKIPKSRRGIYIKSTEPITKYLDNMISKRVIPNYSLTIIQKKGVIYSRISGLSDFEHNAFKVKKNTLFNIGSVTKPVTAALIIKLVEKGYLNLDDPVKKYINRYSIDEVTILNLLTHTSGYDENLNTDIEWPGKSYTIDEYFDKIYSIDTLKYPPDTACEYFTQGYSVLMDIIQTITGKSIESFAQEELFGPLGMKNTTYTPDFSHKESYVLPLRKNDPDKFKYLINTPPTGDTGLYSTSEDLAKFVTLFLNSGTYGKKSIYSSGSIRLMLKEITKGRFEKTPAFWYKGDNNVTGAFGDLNSACAVCHPGFSGTLISIDPEYNIAFSFVTNSNDIHDNYANFKKITDVILACLI